MQNFDNNSFASILRNIRINRQMSQEQFAKLLGTTKQVISRYENGQRTPKITVADEYAQKLGIPLNELLGSVDPALPSGCYPLPETSEIPLVGRIACGTPILAFENVLANVTVPKNVDADFCLQAEGFSMMGDRIMDGDLVFIRKQSLLEDGEIGAVSIDGETTLKHVYYKQGRELTLKSSNPAYPDRHFKNEELNSIRVLGKAVAFISNIK